MIEYIVEIFNGNDVTHVISVEQQDRKKINVVLASESAYRYCTKFRNKNVAQKIASEYNGAKVSPYYGIVTSGAKSTVAPKQNKVNRSTPYRTI